mmetsp:Transcript_5756/g.13389  ORF Transcript_5756/g.13389 Transcript_5756/m.13389 type:complete len:380 (+) Transcript_5756:250-1389(+)
MLVPRDLHDNLVHNLVHRRVEPGPLMRNVPHRSASREDCLSKRRQPSRTIGDSHRKAHESPVSCKTSLDHSSEHRDVDVSSTQWNHDLLSLHLWNIQRPTRKESSKACCSSSLDHSSFMFQEPQNCQSNELLVDQDSLVHIVPCYSEGMRTNGWDSKTVCKGVCDGHGGWLSSLERLRVRCRLLGLNADNLNIWPQRFHCQGDSRNQTSSSNRHNDDIHVWNLLKDLKPNRSCSGADGRVIETVDVLHSLKLLAVHRMFLCLSNVHAVQNNPCTQLLASLDLGKGGDRWHDHRYRDPHQSAMIRQRKSMISCAGCYHSFFLLLICQLFKSVSSPPLFEASSELLVFVLEVEISPSNFAQGVVLCALSVVHMPSNLVSSF